MTFYIHQVIVTVTTFFYGYSTLYLRILMANYNCSLHPVRYRIGVNLKRV